MSKTRQFNPDAKGPLSGTKVLDLSRLVAGNMLSVQLGDFGADVIKIQNPDSGDQSTMKFVTLKSPPSDLVGAAQVLLENDPQLQKAVEAVTEARKLVAKN